MAGREEPGRRAVRPRLFSSPDIFDQIGYRHTFMDRYLGPCVVLKWFFHKNDQPNILRCVEPDTAFTSRSKETERHQLKDV